MYLPLHNVSEKEYYVKIPAKLCFWAVSVPLLAFITCVLLTLYKDFESANSTHCKVPNVVPSISASIGNYEPQQTIWKTAIYVHAPIRFYLIYLRWKYYRSVIQENCYIIVKLAVSLNVIENLALIGLTHWTSSKNYRHHELCFKTFIGTSVFYMLFTCILLSKYRRRPNTTYREMLSVRLKWRAFIVNVGSFAFAAYCFLRHNSMCEPYGLGLQLLAPFFCTFGLHLMKMNVYSMFGLSEYMVVLSNIAFHMTTKYDLKINVIYLTNKGVTAE